MGIFSKKNTSYLGVDLGSGNIKLIELENASGRPRLATYGYLEMPLEDVENGVLNSADKVASVLKKLHKESGARSRQVIASIPISSVFSTILNLPKISKKELASPRNLAPLIYWEAKKFIPLPLNEMILDWQIIPSEPQKSAPILEQSMDASKSQKNKMKEPKTVKNIRVLLNAAAKDLVQKYVSIFKDAGLQLLSLEPDNSALVRSLIGNDPSTVMIVDIGAKVTNLMIVDNKIPYLNKTIQFGGIDFTRAIAGKLNLEYLQAEQFKIDLSKSSGEKFPQVLEENLTDVINEVTYLVNLFGSGHGKSLEKIILTGGSSLIPELAEFLEKNLNIRVYVGDPWARVLSPQELRPVLDDIGPRFSVAIGLVMRQFS